MESPAAGGPPPPYRLEQAAALLPEIRAILLQLAFDRQRLEDDGADGRIGEGMRVLVEHLAGKGIEIRDLDGGLVDIAGDRDGTRIWWCWRLSEPEIGFWHGTTEGFAQRKSL